VAGEGGCEKFVGQYSALKSCTEIGRNVKIDDVDNCISCDDGVAGGYKSLPLAQIMRSHALSNKDQRNRRTPFQFMSRLHHSFTVPNASSKYSYFSFPSLPSSVMNTCMFYFIYCSAQKFDKNNLLPLPLLYPVSPSTIHFKKHDSLLMFTSLRESHFRWQRFNLVLGVSVLSSIEAFIIYERHLGELGVLL
jgi:hypothetical protein